MKNEKNLFDFPSPAKHQYQVHRVIPDQTGQISLDHTKLYFQMNDEHNSPQEVDESLYSRQLYVFGHEAQKKMGSSDILVVGLKGLGIETGTLIDAFFLT